MTTLKQLREFPERDTFMRTNIRQGDKIQTTAGGEHPVLSTHEHHILVPHPKFQNRSFKIPYTQIAKHIPSQVKEDQLTELSDTRREELNSHILNIKPKTKVGQMHLLAAKEAIRNGNGLIATIHLKLAK